MKYSLAAAICLCLSSVSSAVAGDIAISLYSGTQSAPHSIVSGSDPAGAGDFSFTAGWDGKPFDMPPYWGARGTWWQNANWGYMIDFTHSKVYANSETLGASGSSGGFETLEFSDGLNNLTFGLIRRWNYETKRLSPYAGLSAGVVIPHVEVQSTSGAPSTFEYQLAGPSVAWILGASYQLNDRWDLFGEYKGTYSWVRADLAGGGHLDTNIATNALNIGVTLNF